MDTNSRYQHHFDMIERALVIAFTLFILSCFFTNSSAYADFPRSSLSEDEIHHIPRTPTIILTSTTVFRILRSGSGLLFRLSCSARWMTWGVRALHMPAWDLRHCRPTFGSQYGISSLQDGRVPDMRIWSMAGACLTAPTR